MRSSSRGWKTRSLREIYGQHDEELDLDSNFALLSYQQANFEEAIRYDERVKFMDNKIDAIERNETWESVDFPERKRKNYISVKWIYKEKLNVDGKIEKHKTGLVEQGFSQ